MRAFGLCTLVLFTFESQAFACETTYGAGGNSYELAYEDGDGANDMMDDANRNLERGDLNGACHDFRGAIQWLEGGLREVGWARDDFSDAISICRNEGNHQASSDAKFMRDQSDLMIRVYRDRIKEIEDWVRSNCG